MNTTLDIKTYYYSEIIINASELKWYIPGKQTNGEVKDYIEDLLEKEHSAAEIGMHGIMTYSITCHPNRVQHILPLIINGKK